MQTETQTVNWPRSEPPSSILSFQFFHWLLLFFRGGVICSFAYRTLYRWLPVCFSGCPGLSAFKTMKFHILPPFLYKKTPTDFYLIGVYFKCKALL